MDQGPGVVFYLLAFAIIVSGIMVVSLKNIFHCALALVACLFTVAGIFVLLEAEFIAAAQVLIYVGAVAMLMMFAIMLTTNLGREKVAQVNKHALTGVVATGILVLGAIVLISKTSSWVFAKDALPADNILTIGKLLMTTYMLPFEVVSILLLAALIGAIVLAREARS